MSPKENNCAIPPEDLEKVSRHPCYFFDAHHRYARMHLPVAPLCNIGCNYCNRKFDCLHESRPGVTSELLTPYSALEKFNLVREKISNLSVVGIAGPGDALANWEDTRQAILLIRQAAPEIIFCLSTNGLMLPGHAREIVDLGLQHVTVTVNCLDPETGEKIYRYVNFKGQVHRGAGGAGLLIKNQLAGIEYLAKSGVLVKVNIVMIKGINDGQIPDIVRKVKGLGAFMTNIMPLIPAPGSVFTGFPKTSMKELNKMRIACQSDLRQMFHCRQCRADAIGLLGEDRSGEFRAAAGKEAVSKAVMLLNAWSFNPGPGGINVREIAVYVGENGETTSLYEKGKIVVYRKMQGKWKVVDEKCFFLEKGLGIRELREKMREAVSFLGKCRVFVGLSVSGVPYFELEKHNFSIWEFGGKPLKFLDYILEKEEELQEEKAGLEKSGLPPAPVEVLPGCYSISIKEIQEGNTGITSKQALLPFLRGRGFYSLEVLCNHVPPWLEAELAGGGFTWEARVTGHKEIEVRIFKGCCRQGSG